MRALQHAALYARNQQHRSGTVRHVLRVGGFHETLLRGLAIIIEGLGRAPLELWRPVLEQLLEPKVRSACSRSRPLQDETAKRTGRALLSVPVRHREMCCLNVLLQGNGFILLLVDVLGAVIQLAPERPLLFKEEYNRTGSPLARRRRAGTPVRLLFGTRSGRTLWRGAKRIWR